MFQGVSGYAVGGLEGRKGASAGKNGAATLDRFRRNVAAADMMCRPFSLFLFVHTPLALADSASSLAPAYMCWVLAFASFSSCVRFTISLSIIVKRSMDPSFFVPSSIQLKMLSSFMKMTVTLVIKQCHFVSA